MRSLLSADSLRIIKLLETLVLEKNWITIKELSIIINASERTIQSDISLIKKRWGNVLEIEGSSKRGMSIKNRSNSILIEVISIILNESIPLKWLELMFFHPYKSIEFAEEKLFISKSTLLRLLPQISKRLAYFEIEISRSKNSYYLYSKNERQLRRFFSFLLIELYDFKLTGCPINVNLSYLRSLIETEVITGIDSNTFKTAFDFHAVVYAVSLIRENTGFYTAASADSPVQATQKTYKFLSSRFANITKESITAIQDSLYMDVNGWDSPEEKQFVFCEAERQLGDFFKKLDTPIDNTAFRTVRNALSGLYLTMKRYPYDISPLFSRDDYFAIGLQRHNCRVYLLVKELTENYSKATHLPVNIPVRQVLFWVYMTFPDIARLHGEKKLLIISDFSLQHANFTKTFIDNFFNSSKSSQLKIDAFLHPVCLKQEEIEKYDIVLTTTLNLAFKHPNIILISDYPSDKNLLNIHQDIRKCDSASSPLL